MAGYSFPRVHDPGELGRQSVQADSTLAHVVLRATSLTDYAVRFRYPGAPYEPTFAEALTGYELAREVVDAILARLPQQVRP